MHPLAKAPSCCLIGGQTQLLSCAQNLLRHGWQILGIVSDDPKVREFAATSAVPACGLGENWEAFLRGKPCDWLFSIVNFEIIPAAVLQIARRGAVNYHDGPLPRYAGYHATTWALLNREASHGVSWHLMTDGVDEGDVLKQRAVAIEPDDTAVTLNARCYQAALESFDELARELSAATSSPIRQDLAGRTYFRRFDRPPAACTMDWSRPAVELDALVRALDFGTYPNPVGIAKLEAGGQWFAVLGTALADGRSTGRPGLVVEAGDGGLTVETGEGLLRILKVATLAGEPLPPETLLRQTGVSAGSLLPGQDAARAARLGDAYAKACRNESGWLRRLTSHQPVTLPFAAPRRPTSAPEEPFVTIPWRPAPEIKSWLANQASKLSEAGKAGEPRVVLLGAIGILLGKITDATSDFDLGFSDLHWPELLEDEGALFLRAESLRIALDSTSSFTGQLPAFADEVARSRNRSLLSRDLPLRYPECRERFPGGMRSDVRVVFADREDAVIPVRESDALLLVLEADGGMTWRFDRARLEEAGVVQLQRQLAALLSALASASDRRIAELEVMDAGERHRVMVEWNATGADFEEGRCVHAFFEAQAKRVPEAIALVCRGEALTYSELNARANRLAHHLCRLGVGPDAPVGVCVRRSSGLVVALLAVLKAGGAYVPMDPGYPSDRLAFMAKDCGLKVLLTERGLSSQDAAADCEIVFLDELRLDGFPSTNPDVAVGPGHLAYVIYTSGSTGKPKGVMVTHRNVANFFAGMDARIGGGTAGTWLAVTSISFDISVLELFWTLGRGFRVVLGGGPSSPMGQTAATPPLKFSLSYFASDGANADRDRYRLLMEGARFADQNGFWGVWTPERHFHAFGGLFPNPSVTGAALAAVTERVRILAGSVVLPLHHPARVAEEWSVVDNLSGGRVGISFASGWQSNDFVLAPGNYADRKTVMLRGIDAVRRLWRGEALPFAGVEGRAVSIRTLPRPVQPELPAWMTAAGNPETYRLAGELGINLLTHLLGQSLDELAGKIAAYRRAWREHGHPGEGQVTLMLHTFVGKDRNEVRETVRKPLTAYLRSSLDLIKNAPFAFPTFKQSVGAPARGGIQVEGLAPNDLEAILDYAFERYFETSGLFGSVEECLEIVDRVRRIGVDEVACLVDFGIPAPSVLESLHLLNEVRTRSGEHRAAPAQAREEEAIPALIAQHGVTHLQCTPSLARMILLQPGGHEALRSLQKLMIGGEELPISLARQLRPVVTGELHNLYGPTETTVWSTTYPITETNGSVPIGRPIANTQIYLLDRHGRPVATGTPGELFIGGDGVARGYWNRPELTAERFVPNPFSPTSGGRLYRTGDLARYRQDGVLEFLGRLDHQVKVRGFRIELGEIETVLSDHPGVHEVVVVARDGEGGDKTIVAYYAPSRGAEVSPESLRASAASRLPEFMVPAAYVRLDALPRTPNGKVDRRALPAPDRTGRILTAAYEAPQSELERDIAGVWQGLLQLEKVGVADNFFDLGANSLLMIQAQTQLRDTLRREVSLIDLFRFPTIRSLAARFASGANAPTAASSGQDRAQARRDARHRRRPPI